MEILTLHLLGKLFYKMLKQTNAEHEMVVKSLSTVGLLKETYTFVY